MSLGATGHVLDNPVWSSLQGVHAGLGEPALAGAGRVARYRSDVCPFGALADPRDPDSWDALAELLDGNRVCVLVDPASVPRGWEILTSIPGVQMDGTAVDSAHDREALTLADADVSEMLALAERTRPGPFLRRTIEMGRYIGIRQGGELIAMAGERMHPAGWTEISAVCTDTAHRGQGLGGRLVRAVAAGIRDRSERPFLHAASENSGAIRLYEALGFVVRASPTFTVLRENGRSQPLIPAAVSRRARPSSRPRSG